MTTLETRARIFVLVILAAFPALPEHGEGSAPLLRRAADVTLCAAKAPGAFAS